MRADGQSSPLLSHLPTYSVWSVYSFGLFGEDSKEKLGKKRGAML